MKNKGIILGLIAIAVLVVGYFVWNGSDNSLDMSSHKKKNRKGGRPSEKEQETAEQNAHW